MKKIFEFTILLCFLTLSCSEDNPLVQDDGIQWDQITGKMAYIKGNALYLIDGDSATVKFLRTTNLYNLKWNKFSSQITGIQFMNDSTYRLEAIDLEGNLSVIKYDFSSEYYDWLPDGRLLTISEDHKIVIDDEVLLNETFNPVFGLACSPNGNKIVVSTDNILENYLLEIDINSLNQKILERNLNLFDPNFEQPIYSLKSDKVLYVTYKYVFRLFDPSLHQYRVWSMPRIELGAGKDIFRSDNPQRILYTKVDASYGKLIGIYSMDIYDGNTVELINGGRTPIWIY